MTPLFSSATLSTRVRLVVVLASVVLIGGCGGQPENDGAATSEPVATASEPTGSESAAVGPEVGTWETAPVTREQLLQTLEDAGFGRHARRFGSLPGWLPEREAVFSLELRDGSWTEYATLDEEAPTIFDQQTYEVTDAGFTLTSGVGQTVLRPTMDTETLTLEFVSSTEPAAQEVPVEAILRVYYTTAPFHRTGS